MAAEVTAAMAATAMAMTMTVMATMATMATTRDDGDGETTINLKRNWKSGGGDNDNVVVVDEEDRAAEHELLDRMAGARLGQFTSNLASRLGGE